MPKILGIDLSPGAVKIVEIEMGVQPPKIYNYSINHLPPENIGETHFNIIDRVLKEKKIATRKAIISVSCTEIYYHLLELPPMPSAEVAGAIGVKLNSILPKGDKKPIVDFFKLVGIQHENKGLYFVVAAERYLIQRILDLSHQINLTLVDVVSGACALYFGANIKGTGNYALIDIKKHSSLVVLVKLGQIVFSREISIGTDSIRKSLVEVVVGEAGKLEIDDDKAEKILTEFGIPVDLDEYSARSGLPAYDINSMMRPALEKIAAEILRTFDYYKKQTGDQVEFKQLYFTGFASQLKNMVKYLDSILHYEVINLTAEDESSCLTMAIGAAEERSAVLSLYAPDLRFPIMSIVKKYLALELPLVFLILIMGMVWFSLFERNKTLDRQLVQLREQVRTQAPDLSEPSVMEMAILGFSSDLGFQQNVVKAVKALPDAVPQSVYLEEVNFKKTERMLIVRGVVEKKSKAGISEFVNRLNLSKYFTSVDLVSLVDSDVYNIPTHNFEIRCVLSEAVQK